MILRALLPVVGDGIGAAAAGGTPGADDAAAAVTGAGVLAVTAAPHLLQNLVPGLSVAPQELQNAIITSRSRAGKNRRREYTADQGLTEQITSSRD
jgi:hypothetical protein